MDWIRRLSACALVGVALGAAGPAAAKETFGPNINAFCTQNNRIPATPYGSQFPTQCQLCHKAGTFDKSPANHVQPNWDAFVAAYPGLGGNGDYSFFCPDSAGNRPPVLAPIGDRSVDPGLQLTFMLTATDPDGDALTFSAMNLPAGANLTQTPGSTSASFAWTPTVDQVGNYVVTFTVTDDGAPAASDSETLTISVGNVNHPPVLALIGDRTVYEGAPFEIDAQATDPDGDALTFAVDGLPVGASLVDHGDGTATFGWTPAMGSAGSFPLTASVTDGGTPALSDSEDFTVTVIARPPGAIFLTKAKFSAKKGSLKVKGAGAAASSAVEILAVGDTGLVSLGNATANKKGKFGLKTTANPGPCTLVARVDDLVSMPLAVVGAPDTCTAP